MIAFTLQAGRGFWVMGVVGAVAELTATDDADVQVHTEGDGITAYTHNGAIRMTIDEDVRALTFDPPGLMQEPRIVLAVKRERGRLPVADGVTDLSPDTGALLQEDSAWIYDHGLGRKEGRSGSDCWRAKRKRRSRVQRAWGLDKRLP